MGLGGVNLGVLKGIQVGKMMSVGIDPCGVGRRTEVMRGQWDKGVIMRVTIFVAVLSGAQTK